jgi:hypothetical protein
MQLINLPASIFYGSQNFKVYSYLSIVHIFIFLLCYLQANLFKRCIPIIIIMIFNQQIGFSTFEFHFAYCSATKYYPSSIQWIGNGSFGPGNHPSILSSGPLRRIHFHFAKYSSLLIQCSDFDIILEIQYASCVFGLALKS